MVAAELFQLVPMLSLAFFSAGNGYLLVAVISLLPGQNLFVDATKRAMATCCPTRLPASLKTP